MANVKYIYIIIGVSLCMAAQVLLGSCTADADPDASQDVRELRLSLGSQRFSGSGARATRALPSDFVAYDAERSPFEQIHCYLTHQETSGSWATVGCVFDYKRTDADADTWVSKVALKSGSTYYLYGYMPKAAVGSAAIAPYASDYAQGAVLTLTGLNAVTPDDICVIVGAEGFGTTVPDMSGRLGKFGYDTSSGDNLFLLIDHIYAGLQFKMRLGDTYSQLRGIKVKSIKLMPDNGDDTVIEKVTATVTIVANATGINPIVPIDRPDGTKMGGSVTFSDFETGSNPEPAVLYEGDGKDLTTTPETFLACFCPSTNTNFILETKYDVYDRKGNLIRPDQTAKNAITLTENLTPGRTHTIDISVQPTFLYMLSDPDLDNPTFNVGS